MNLLFIILGIIIIIGMAFTYGIHLTMTLIAKESYKIIGFFKFKKEFNSIKKWETNDFFPGSLFSYDHTSSIHADMFEFNKVNMLILNPVSYYLIRIFLIYKIYF
jgi:hypothetical protein